MRRARREHAPSLAVQTRYANLRARRRRSLRWETGAIRRRVAGDGTRRGIAGADGDVQVRVLVEDVYDPDVAELLEALQGGGRDVASKREATARQRDELRLPRRSVTSTEAGAKPTDGPQWVQLHLVRVVGSVRVRGDGRASLRGTRFAAVAAVNTAYLFPGGVLVPVASTPADASIVRQREEPKFRLSQLSLSLDPSPSFAHLRRRLSRDGRSQRLKRRVDVVLFVWCRHRDRRGARRTVQDRRREAKKCNVGKRDDALFLSGSSSSRPSKRPHAPARSPSGLGARMASSSCCSQRLAARGFVRQRVARQRLGTAARPSRANVGSGHDASSPPAPALPARTWRTTRRASDDGTYAGWHLPDASKARGMRVETLFVLETNVDDLSPQIVAYALEEMLAAGALDAWSVAATMKKGRMGSLLCALCDKTHVDTLCEILFQVRV